MIAGFLATAKLAGVRKLKESSRLAFELEGKDLLETEKSVEERKLEESTRFKAKLESMDLSETDNSVRERKLEESSRFKDKLKSKGLLRRAKVAAAAAGERERVGGATATNGGRGDDDVFEEDKVVQPLLRRTFVAKPRECKKDFMSRAKNFLEVRLMKQFKGTMTAERIVWLLRNKPVDQSVWNIFGGETNETVQRTMKAERIVRLLRNKPVDQSVRNILAAGIVNFERSDNLIKISSLTASP